MIKELDYRKVLEMAPYAYADHQLVYDDKGRPCDYIFLDVNQAFEKMTGLKRGLVLGNSATEVIPGVRDNTFDWVEFYGTPGSSDKKEFHQYSEPLRRWYKGHVVYPEPGRFITYFYDASHESHRLETSRTLITSLKDMIFELDENYIIRNVIVMDETLLFLPKDDFMNCCIKDVLNDELAKRFVAALEENKNTGRRAALVYASPYPEDERWFKAEIFHEKDLRGDTKHIVIIQDMTEQQMLENRIKEQSNRINQFFEVIPDLLCITDLQGNFKMINNSWGKILGYSVHWLQEQNFMDFVHLEDVDLTMKAIESLDTGHVVSGFINRYIKEDGTYVYLEWHSIANEGFIYAVARDITLKLESEKKLSESESRYRAMLESQQDLIVRVAPDNRFTYVNQAYCNKFGKSKEELLGKTFLPLVHPDDQKNTLEALENLKKPPYRVKIEQRAKTTEGWRWIAWEDYAIRDEMGNIIEVQAVGRDITPVKEKEAKLLEALNEKDIMIKEIHHRVKNNLQVISSLLYLQSSYHDNQLAGKILQDSQNRIQAMALLHEKIYQSDNFNKIDMPEYLESISRQIMSYYTFTTGNIELQVNIADLDISIEKAISCGLIVNELVTNSLQHAFTDKCNGFIRVDMQPEEPGFVKLAVKDNGRGFPEGFDPLTNDTLGLQLVFNLAEQLNGNFKYANESVGAIVEINFPITESE